MTNDDILITIATAQIECTVAGIFDKDKICQHIFVSLEQNGLIHDLVIENVENIKEGVVHTHKDYSYVGLDINYCEYSNVVAEALLVRWKTFTHLYNPYHYGNAVNEGFSRLA